MAQPRGAYGTLRLTYDALAEWMEAKGHSPSGLPWEVYLTDPAEVPDPANWRTEVVWPVGRRV